MDKKRHKKHESYESLDNIETLQKNLTQLAIEKSLLVDEIDRLNFLLEQKDKQSKIGYVRIDIEYLLNILYFEKYYMKQSAARLVYHEKSFVRLVPDYELVNDESERIDLKPKKFDSIY